MPSEVNERDAARAKLGPASQPRWSKVDELIERALIPVDGALAASLAANAQAGLPAQDVSPPQGKLLQLLVQIQGARRVLEIGTLGGYSSIWLARGLPSGGRLTTLELDPARAELARLNLRRAGLEAVVEVRSGAALHSLQALKSEGAGPFDLIFIDADKPNHPCYLDWALELAPPAASSSVITWCAAQPWSTRAARMPACWACGRSCSSWGLIPD